MRRLRETEAPEQQQQRLTQDFLCHAKQRSAEAPEHWQQRLTQDLLRHAEQRSAEAQEQRQQRLIQDLVCHRLNRARPTLYTGRGADCNIDNLRLVDNQGQSMEP